MVNKKVTTYGSLRCTSDNRFIAWFGCKCFLNGTFCGPSLGNKNVYSDIMLCALMWLSDIEVDFVQQMRDMCETMSTLFQ